MSARLMAMAAAKSASSEAISTGHKNLKSVSDTWHLDSVIKRRGHAAAAANTRVGGVVKCATSVEN
jgi:hypothetical protein